MTTMNANNYICPCCRGHLLVEEHIVFSVKNENKEAGILLLSPKIGNYSVLRHPSFEISEGEHLEIYCPICHANLEADNVSKNLARVIMIDSLGKEFEILFSEIVGEQCTYQISGDSFNAYGEDVEEYTNFFGEMSKY